ncbi:hypothetical protein Anapl_17275 [Anas platyrhynchos]|uniref:Uncharacterized protein n=1 Tax=Anas platyrhynchos TaxID=8839 RepID=R0JJG5_ANAPL|nr:hypothetical protein Anapl_17275 [Anas platyrhynchos]
MSKHEGKKGKADQYSESTRHECDGTNRKRYFYGSLSISLAFLLIHGHKTPFLGVIKLKQTNNNNEVFSLHHEVEGTISAKSNVTEDEEVENTCKVV